MLIIWIQTHWTLQDVCAIQDANPNRLEVVAQLNPGAAEADYILDSF